MQLCLRLPIDSITHNCLKQICLQGVSISALSCAVSGPDEDTEMTASCACNVMASCLLNCMFLVLQISHNRSLDGVLDLLNSKNMTEAGPVDLIDDEAADVDDVLPPPPEGQPSPPHACPPMV